MAVKEAIDKRTANDAEAMTGNRLFATRIEDGWQLCSENREGFRKYLQGGALSLRNLDWIFRHETARHYLENALRDIDRNENAVAFGCVSRMKDLFELDINLNDGGDPDALCDFTRACRSLVAEARADLHRHPPARGISFTPLEVYLTDLETGTFGFYPVEHDGGSEESIASWQH